MIPLIALLATVAAAGPVTELSIVPVADRTEVIIRLDAGTAARDFMMEDGRLVVDIEGASTSAARYDDLNRGGVLALRVAQFQPSIVRVVIELAQPLEYRIEREANGLRVSFRNDGGSFQPWSSSGRVAQQPQQQEPAARNVEPVAQEPQRNVVPVQQRQQEPITVTFDAVPVPDVLAAFAAVSGRSIIPSPDVRTQTVTAEIVNLPWDVALQAILESHDMTMRELESGVFIVESGRATSLRAESEPIESRQFAIQYTSADSLLASVQGLLTGDGQVAANRSSNTLLVTDRRSALDRIGPVIEQLDVRTAQINISARIAFINRTALEELGVSYDLKDSRGTRLGGLVDNPIDSDGDGVFESGETTEDDVILLGGNSIAALGNANAGGRVQDPSLSLALSLILGRHTLVSFLEALQTVNLTDVQAAPVVTTLDHRTARVQVGQETPVEVASPQATGEVRYTVEYKQTGVILNVTPHVTGNLVMLEILAERSQVQPGPSRAGIVFETTNATTQVLVEDGETAVIAGLTETQITQVRTGIPILMDLPVIGRLFRRTRNEEIKRDLLIMVTPHIVR